MQANAQFSINVQADPAFTPKEAYFYTENGSKDILVSKVTKTGNSWNLKYPKAYVGMMKVYFPDTNSSLSFISENKDVNFSISSKNNKITSVNYLDPANKLMDDMQSRQRKKEVILPALYEMKGYYQPTSDFAKAIDAEITNLSNETTVNAAANPFVAYYKTNYNRFLVQHATSPKPTQDEIINFINTSDEKLETSTLLRPILTSYLQNAGSDTDTAIQKLLDVVKLESPRGQTVLSEFIDIFDSYGMNDLKKKYLAQAQGLKCTINDRLASTIQSNKNTEIGATFPNNKFQSAVNTSAKSLHGIKADKKVVVFWSSTCSHCETELPQLIPVYNTLKSKNIEIIGLSLDADRASYENKIKSFPWVNDSELRGWYSSYSDTYNVHATPTYFILDANNKIIGKPDHVGDVLAELGVK